MEKSSYNLLNEILFRLDRERILEKVVLIGSWCLYFYQDFFKAGKFLPSIRTRDIDILVPVPVRFDHKTDVHNLVKDLGFVLDFRQPDGFMRLMHPELILEFLVPERGRSQGKPFDLPELGINAQPLRFLEFLIDTTLCMDSLGLKVTIPHPSNFALHKLIISSRRKSDKKTKDINQAIMVLHALIDEGLNSSLREVFEGMPQKWQKAALQPLKTMKEERILEVLS